MTDRVVPGNPKPITNADLLATLVPGEGIIIDGVPGTGVDPFASLLAEGDGIDVSYNSGTRTWTITATGGGGGGGGGANLSVSTTSTTVVVASDSGSDATITAATALAAGVMTAAMFSTLQSALQEEFETVAKNLKSYPNARSYTGARLDSVTYTVPGGTIVKTLNYTGDKLTSIVLSENTPSGIELTKTLTWSGDNLTGVAYS